MSKIDTTKWKGFKIVDLFSVVNAHSILKTSIVEDSGNIPYVTASNENNGVFSYVEYDMEQIEKGNAIMIGGKTLTVTYQEKDFFSNDSHNLILYLKDERFRTEKIYLFLVTALKASFGNSYSWGNSISYRSIQKDKIYLPVKEDGTPDFEFMETYMQDVESTTQTSLNYLRSAVQQID